MKKKFSKTGKKVLSVFLACLMLMTCWVWVAPEKAEAAEDLSTLKQLITDTEYWLDANNVGYWGNLAELSTAYNNAKRYYDAVTYGGYEGSSASTYATALQTAFNNSAANTETTFVKFIDTTVTEKNGTSVPNAYANNVIYHPYDFEYDTGKSTVALNNQTMAWNMQNIVVGIVDGETSTVPFQVFFFPSKSSTNLEGFRILNTDRFTPASTWTLGGTVSTSSSSYDGFGQWIYDGTGTSLGSVTTSSSSSYFSGSNGQLYYASTYASVIANVNSSTRSSYANVGLRLVTKSTDKTSGDLYASNAGQGYVYQVYMHPYIDNYENWKSIIPNISLANYSGYVYPGGQAALGHLDTAAQSYNLDYNNYGFAATGDILTAVSNWANDLASVGTHLSNAKTAAANLATVTPKYNDLISAITAADSIVGDSVYYTPASWAAFETAYNNARAHMASLNPDDSNEQYSSDATTIGNLASALDSARNALEWVTLTFDCVEDSKDVTYSGSTKTVWVGMTANDISALAPANKAQTYDESKHYDYSWPTFSALTDSTTYTEITTPVGHSYNSTATEPGTECEGYTQTTTYDCKFCDYTYDVVETITATGHNYVKGSIVDAATCTASATYNYTCDKCGATEVRSDGDPLGHTYNPVDLVNNGDTHSGPCSRCGVEMTEDHTLGYSQTVAPDCENQGYDIYTCVCGYSEKKNYVAASGHTWQESDDEKYLVSEATCTEEGVYYKSCSVCGKASTETFTTDVIPHTPGEEQIENEVAETCTTDGSYDIVVYCTECPAEISRKTIPVTASGHTAGKAVTENEVAATCTADGSYDTVVYCTVCKNEISRETIPVTASGHTAGKAVTENFVDSDCTNAGSYDTVVYCTECKAEISRETETIEAKGHTEGKAVEENRVEATCGADGSYDTVVYCTVCKAELDRDTITIPATGNHNYVTEVDREEATCTEDGYYVMACGCGAEKEYPIGALGHNEIEHAAQAATCTEKGWDAYVTCSRCDYSTYKEIEALGHNKIAHEAQEATCTEIGWEAYETCSRCNYSTYKEIPALGHNKIAHEAQEATCTEIGWEAYVTCSRCDYSTYKEIEALGHTQDEAVTENEVEPDCTNAGSYDTVVYCAVCGDELDRDTTVVPANGHTDGEEEIENEVEPDCTNAGSYDTVVYCDVCGDELDRDTIVVPATGHTDGEEEIENEVAATCTSEGSYDTVVYCTVCGDETSRETTIVPMLEHTWQDKADEKYLKSAATCTAEGVYFKSCSVCGEVSTETFTTGMLDHTEDKAVTENEVDPDCTNKGSYDTVVYCSVCGKELSRETIPVKALGHDEIEHEAQEATCTEIGWDAYETCSRCDYSTYKEIEALGHTIVKVDGKEATCTEDGWKDYEYCEKCDYTTFEEILSSGVGHSYGEKVTVKEATCCEEGLAVKTCSACGHEVEYTIKMDKNAHDFEGSEWVQTTFDCSAGYYTFERECANGCGKTETMTDNNVAHSWKTTVKANPTCVQDAYIKEECTVCGFTQTVTADDDASLKATGKHTWGDDTLVSNATCCENEKWNHTCSVCGEVEAWEEENTKTNDCESNLVKWVAYPATCDTDGYIEHWRSSCGKYFISNDKGKTFTEVDWDTQVYLAKTDHADKDLDGKCDHCSAVVENGDTTKGHSCLCHKTNWFMKIIYKIFRFFWKIFRINKTCACGAVHY